MGEVYTLCMVSLCSAVMASSIMDALGSLKPRSVGGFAKIARSLSGYNRENESTRNLSHHVKIS